MLDVYADFAENEAAVPVIKGRKSESEKFAGALHSYSIEAMMGDTRALQAGTSHNLGDNFSRAFEIRYLDQNNNLQYCWTTSWGLSTRFVGAIIMVHGDDQGLILPPRLAPYQVVIVPIFKDDAQRSKVMEQIQAVQGQLGDFRVKLDDREGITPGFKFNDWELRGVPVRVEIGPKDVEKGTVALARRDRPGREGKQVVPQENLAHGVAELLDDVQKSIFERAKSFMAENTHQVDDYEDFKEVVQNGWAEVWWCMDADCEAAIKEETKATCRCIPLDQEGGEGTCIRCGEKADQRAIFAKAY
jgi:prolyl-tRNA synthetase